MKVYILTRRDEPPHYDVNNKVCVVAVSPRQARGLASTMSGDEGFAVWLDPKHSTCKVANLSAPGVLCVEGCDG